MKVLDVNSVQAGIDQTITDIENVRSQIEPIQRAVRDFHSLEEDLKGKGGRAIRAFYQDTHEPLLIFLHQSLTDYENLLKEMKEAIETFEPDTSGYIHQEFLENKVIEGLDKVEAQVTELTSDANGILRSINDLVAIPEIDPSQVMDDIQDVKEKDNDIVEELIILDNYETSQVEQTKDALHLMRTFIRDMESKFESGDLSIADYKEVSLQKLDSYKAIQDRVYSENEEKRNERSREIEEAKDLRDSVLKNADRSSKMVGNKAFIDFLDGNITRETYNETMTTLGKIQKELSEEELNEEVSEAFLEYLWDNRVEFAVDTTISSITEYAKTHGSLKLGGMINAFRGIKGDGFVMVNPKSSQYAQPFLNPKAHKWAVNAGKWGGRVATPVGFGVGWYDDVQNQDKTHGQAIAHNTFTIGAGLGVGAVWFGLVSNPGGWAILGIAATATLASKAADYFYNNSEIVGKSVDWVGNRLSDIGQGIKSFFSGSNAAHTKYHTSGFNAP